MQCIPNSTPVNGESRPNVLKVRRILVKSWLCPLLVYVQDKAASSKVRLYIPKERWREPVEESNFFNTTLLICSLAVPAVPDRWSLHGGWTWTHTHTRASSKAVIAWFKFIKNKISSSFIKFDKVYYHHRRSYNNCFPWPQITFYLIKPLFGLKKITQILMWQ